ncbi:MAG: TonB-dependent receptor [Myxococcales bacterium]|nr:TonB-dependent receptor [Myxococcales bacterium]
MRSRSLALAIALGALAAPSFVPSPAARAQDRSGTADEAEVAFQLGNAAYQAGDFRAALAHYFASNRLAPNRQVLFNLARCYEQLGQPIEAYRYYQEHAGAAGGDDASAEKSRAAMARLGDKVALLDVVTAPRGATVYLNRKELGAYGVTPRLIAVSPGAYDVLVERAGYQPATRHVDARLGATATVEIPLVQLTGTLVVTGSPAGAEVTVDDGETAHRGQLPSATLALPAGDHTLRVTAAGHVTQEMPVTVRPDGTTRLDVQLAMETGAVVVHADEAGALVRIDGEPRGFTPVVLDAVPVGEHLLEVELEGYRAFSQRVTVTADASAEVEARLAISDEIAAASRTAEAQGDAPASVSVVSGLERRAFGYTTIADALRGVRGVYLNDDLTYQSAGFRGVSTFGDYGNRVLVQLDGHALNDDWIGSSYIGFDGAIGLHMVERVEVVRGPGSTLHGTGAMLGVVNLVTPSEVRDLRGFAGASMVDPRSLRAYASVEVPFGDGDGAWVYGGGLYTQPGTYTSAARAGDPGEPTAVASGVGETSAVGLMAKLRAGAWTLAGSYNGRDRQIPTGAFETLFGDPRTATVDRRGFVELRFEPRLGDDLELLARASVDHYAYHGTYAYDEEDGGLLDERYTGWWTGLEARVIGRPASGLRLTAGGEWKWHLDNHERGEDGTGEAYLDEEHPYHSFSLYVNGDWRVADLLTVTAGARFDGWLFSDLPTGEGGAESRFFSALNPRLALIFRPEAGHVLKVIGGRAYRAPSVYELTYNDGGFTQTPAPELDPESAWSAEVEYDVALADGLGLVAGASATRIAGLVLLEGGDEDVDVLHFENRADAVWSLAAEVELRRELRQGTMFSLSYTLADAREGDALSGARIPSSPTHLAAAKLIVPLLGREMSLATRLTVDAGRLARDGEKLGAGVLWDLGLWGLVAGGRVEYSVSVRNLLDWDYRYPVGDDVLDRTVPAPGVSVVADLTARF